MKKITNCLYRWVYSGWVWFARKVIRVPFIMEWNKDGFISAVTFSWSLEYAQTVRDGWDISQRYNTLLTHHKDLQHKYQVLKEKMAESEGK